MNAISQPPNTHRSLIGSALACAAAALACVLLPAISLADTRPVVALIIDDIGPGRPAGERAIALPGPLAFAVLPGTPAGPGLARLAHAEGKEVLLHQPLQPIDPLKDPGPRAITTEMGPAQIGAMLTRNLQDVPHAIGVSTHMGSLVTEQLTPMGWLAEALAREPGMVFVDSYTNPASQAFEAARARGLPALRRDVFLDSNPDPAAIEAQFIRLLRLARRQGSAVGIGHPYPETLDFLEQSLPIIEANGIRLVSVRELIIVREAHEVARAAQASAAPRIAIGAAQGIESAGQTAKMPN